MQRKGFMLLIASLYASVVGWSSTSEAREKIETSTFEAWADTTSSTVSKAFIPKVTGISGTNISLKYRNVKNATVLAACAFGTAWHGDPQKACKYNNKRRMADAYCRANGFTKAKTNWQTSVRGPGGYVLTRKVDIGQTWEQGEWWPLGYQSSDTMEKFDLIYCTKNENIGVVSSVRLLDLSKRLPIDICMYPENGGSCRVGNSQRDCCGSHARAKIAQAICTKAGYGKYASDKPQAIIASRQQPIEKWNPLYYLEKNFGSWSDRSRWVGINYSRQWFASVKCRMP